MTKNKFSKPPVMTDTEREKKVEEFVSASYFNKDVKTIEKETEISQKASQRKTKKDDVKPLYLRLPEPLLLDLKEISAITGLSINGICIEFLRIAVKEKIKDLKS